GLVRVRRGAGGALGRRVGRALGGAHLVEGGGEVGRGVLPRPPGPQRLAGGGQLGVVALQRGALGARLRLVGRQRGLLRAQAPLGGGDRRVELGGPRGERSRPPARGVGGEPQRVERRGRCAAPLVGGLLLGRR